MAGLSRQLSAISFVCRRIEDFAPQLKVQPRTQISRPEAVRGLLQAEG